jgi:hypothetical protein
MEKSQYKSLSEWRKAEPKAYDAAYRRQILHMIAENYGWTYKVYFLPFEEAKKFVHTLKLKNQKEWLNYCKNNKPDNIPSTPRDVYKNKGWVSFGDWLGNGRLKRVKHFLPFEEARTFVHSLKLENYKEWKIYCKSGSKPDNIPYSPNKVYRDKGWISHNDWLGYSKTFLSFEKARTFVHTLKLKSQKEWHIYCKSGNKPDNISCSPNIVYRDKGWISIGDWLGNNNVKKGDILYLDFKKARSIVRSLKLKNIKEWDNYCKCDKPIDIPYAPRFVYKDKGWLSWGDWLGKK